MYIVRSGAADKFDSLVSELGQNPIEIMKQVGLSAAQFRDPDTYIANSRLAELLENAAILCQEPMFGVLLAQRQGASALGDLSMLVARAKTVREALRLANDYLYLQSSGVKFSMVPQDDWMKLCLSIDTYSDQITTQLMQISVMQMARFVANLLNIDTNSFTLHLTQSGNLDNRSSSYANVPKIRFGEKFNGIMLKTSLLDTRNHQDEEALNRHFQEHLKYLQNRYPNNLSDQARDMIGRLLPTGECSVEQVARALDMHPRMLQIRLKEYGENYSKLLRQVRQNFAERRLNENVQSITDIALQLGYAEAAVFSRHFRKWTGKSPSQWRKDQTETNTN
ncbi:Arabinose-binding domain of AraC transcription regulator [Vibrio sp. B1FLJ16]|uniref:AraC family transcriptional regulator n=1 Tax=Vibrio sp. B1FLJ16 TaxID=2751178 RepID=UPI0015F469D6|nr:AraC family transcriptional regulator [Vibrio sp. B1FLJ16]CAD7823114.1 Arabinose-binding domain of AraC transcription regulator [Vibrio sp. B1FLJ16]CAE6950984.1 Arabinose-binding domain of AraC transcription regulator [Vibrio sp. B1FLJ16]